MGSHVLNALAYGYPLVNGWKGERVEREGRFAFRTCDDDSHPAGLLPDRRSLRGNTLLMTLRTRPAKRQESISYFRVLFSTVWGRLKSKQGGYVLKKIVRVNNQTPVGKYREG